MHIYGPAFYYNLINFLSLSIQIMIACCSQSCRPIASLKRWTQWRYCHNKEEVWGCAERIPRSFKYPAVSEDERAQTSQITLSAQTASLIVGCLSDVGCWDVTPLIESHNKDLVWTAPSVVYCYCNHHNNLAPKTSNGGVEAAGICIAAFDLGKSKQSILSYCKWCEGYNALPSLCLSFQLLSQPLLLS